MTSRQPPVARCVTMQKNERTLLEPWILHHARLFGFEALTVIDNGSDLPAVLKLLQRYERRGVTVIRDYPTPADFGRKGEIVTSVIQSWDREGGYDFAIPLDCDEFLVSFTSRLAWDRASVLGSLALMRGHATTFINDRLLLNVPHRPGYFRPQIVNRSLFAAGTIVGLDRGFHEPQTIYPERRMRAPLACLHLHNRPSYADIQTAARQKLYRLIGDADPATVAPTAESGHLYFYFQVPEADFIQQYRIHPDIYVPGLLHCFEQRGMDWKSLLGVGGIQPDIRSSNGYFAHRTEDNEKKHIFQPFDAAFYAEHNPDVANDPHFGRWPLVHFIETGWKEGRESCPTGEDVFIVE